MKKLVLIVFLLLANISFSQCVPVLDQNHVTSWAGSGALPDHWQSFTAGSNGELSRVVVVSNGFINATLILSIYAGTGVGGTLLYTATEAFNISGGAPEVVWNINCETMPIVSTGNSYTIRIQGSFNTGYNGTNPYPGGYYYNNNLGVQTGADMNFKTYVSNPNKPVIGLTSTNVTCNGWNDGQVISTVGSGSPAYTYSWSSGENSANISNKVAGNYILTVTDNNSCVSCPETVTLTEPPLVSVVISGGDQTICEGSSASISSVTSNAITYSWSPTAYLSSINTTNTIASPITTTVYTLTGMDANGCSATDNITINVNPAPIVNAGADFQSCESEQIILSASGTAIGYTWDNGVTNNSSFIPTVGSTSYIVTGTDAIGCQNIDSVTVLVNPGPIVTLNGITNFCENESTYSLIEGTPAGGIYSGAGITSNIFDPSAATIGTNSVIYIYTDVNNCSDSAYQDVIVYAAPTVSTSADQIICHGDEIVLIGEGASTYTWDNGVIDNSPFTPEIGSITYTVNGIGVNGCQNTAQTTVTVNPIPLLVSSPDQIFCFEDNIILNVSGANTYIWNNGDGSNDIFEISPNTSTTVSVIGYLLGCSSENIISLTLDDPNTVNTGLDVDVCKGFGINIEAFGGVDYFWNGPNTNNVNEQNVYITVDSSAFYYATISTENGCVYTDSIFVTALTDPSCSIEFTNTLSPNHDGINDFWTIEGIESFEENLVVIYNRWGDIVFEENNYDNTTIKWEGTNSLGNDAIPGTYFYRIELTNGPTYSGWIELMR